MTEGVRQGLEKDVVACRLLLLLLAAAAAAAAPAVAVFGTKHLFFNGGLCECVCDWVSRAFFVGVVLGPVLGTTLWPSLAVVGGRSLSSEQGALAVSCSRVCGRLARLAEKN